MSDQDNVSLDKISLTSNDFADDLGSNTFGIQDTQVIASENLNSFLLSNPDDVKSVDDNSTTPLSNSQEQKRINTPRNTEENKFQSDKEASAKSTSEKEEPSGRDALEDVLFGSKTSQEENKNISPEVSKESVQSSDDETYLTLGKDLLRLGVFTKNTEDESEENISTNTPEEFLERFSLEKKKGAIGILDSFLSQFGEDRRRLFDSVFVNGVEPQEYLNTFAKIESIKNINLTEEKNQERVVRSYYKGLNWDEGKIENRIQKLKDYGDLEDEAKSYQEILLNKENEKELELNKKKEVEKSALAEREATQKNSYLRILTDKIKAQEMDGIPVNEKEAQATLSYLTEKKYKLESGELLSEFDKDLLELNRPENHEQKVKLGLLLRKKLDLSSVKKASISKKSDALFTLSTKNAKQVTKEKEIKSFF